MESKEGNLEKSKELANNGQFDSQGMKEGMDPMAKEGDGSLAGNPDDLLENQEKGNDTEIPKENNGDSENEQENPNPDGPPDEIEETKLGDDIGEGENAIGPDVNEFDKEEKLSETVIETVVRLRFSLDRINQLSKVRTLSTYGESKSIFKAKAWLGKLLSQLGAPNPYAGEDKIKSAKDIPATAQTVSGPEFDKAKYQFGLLSPVDAVIQLRSELQDIISQLESIDLREEDVKDGRHSAIAATQSYIHMCEAKFEFGHILSLLKK